MAIPAILVTLVLLINLLLVVSIFADPIVGLVRQRIPNFSYEGGMFLLWGLGLIAAFVMGLVVMYLLLKL